MRRSVTNRPRRGRMRTALAAQSGMTRSAVHSPATNGHFTRRREPLRSLVVRGLVRGVAGGLVGTAAMSTAMLAAQKSGLMGQMPPQKISDSPPREARAPVCDAAPRAACARDALALRLRRSVRRAVRSRSCAAASRSGDGGESSAAAYVRVGARVRHRRLGAELCRLGAGRAHHADAARRSPGSSDVDGGRALGLRRRGREDHGRSRAHLKSWAAVA